MSWTELVKQFIGLDVIFGTRTKKLGGINDNQYQVTANLVFDSFDDSITFPNNDMPPWVSIDRYFRVTGGLNDGFLYRIKNITTANKFTIYESVIPDTGNYTIDARLWRVHQNTVITRESPTGGTMYNLDNLIDTGVPRDGSSLAKVPVVHYHTDHIELWKLNIHPIGLKNNQNLIFILPDGELFKEGRINVYLSCLRLNGDQTDSERDFDYLPDRSGFTLNLDPSKRWRLNCPPLQDESLLVDYIQDKP